MIRVYSDASISPATMESIQTSRLGSFVGRILVIIPELDYGYIEKVRDAALDAKGNPASTQMEIVAIKKAKEICLRKSISEFVILTDNMSAAEQSGVPEAKWLEVGERHIASLFMQRIINRARYLRQSDRKVANRAAPTRLQDEVFEFFKTDSKEFLLTKSMLWQKIQMELSAYP